MTLSLLNFLDAETLTGQMKAELDLNCQLCVCVCLLMVAFF